MEKYGVVLAGGGAKGVYQIGAWRALRELDIPCLLYTSYIASAFLFHMASLLFMASSALLIICSLIRSNNVCS